MVWDRSLYLNDWEDLSVRLKVEAAWRCQQCGKPCRKTRETVDDFLARVDGMPEAEVRLHPQKWVLTVAHLNHDPKDNSPGNLKPLCVPCHARMDISPSAMAQKRFLHLERQGQLRLALV